MTAYSALIGSGILAAFVDFRVHSGRSVSEWAIMACSHRVTLDRSLARAVPPLRSQIEEYSNRPTLINTVPQVGYRFEG